MALSAALALTPTRNRRNATRARKGASKLSLWALQFTSHVSLAAPHRLCWSRRQRRIVRRPGSAAETDRRGVASRLQRRARFRPPTPHRRAGCGEKRLHRTPAYAHRTMPRPAGLPATSRWRASLAAPSLAWRAQRRRPAGIAARRLEAPLRRFFTRRDRPRFRPHPDRSAPSWGRNPSRQPAAAGPAESSEALVFACQRGLRQLEGFCAPANRRSNRNRAHLHHERATRRDAQTAPPSPSPDAAQPPTPGASPCCFPSA